MRAAGCLSAPARHTTAPAAAQNVCHLDSSYSGRDLQRRCRIVRLLERGGAGSQRSALWAAGAASPYRCRALSPPRASPGTRCVGGVLSVGQIHGSQDEGSNRGRNGADPYPCCFAGRLGSQLRALFKASVQANSGRLIVGGERPWPQTPLNACTWLAWLLAPSCT